MRRLNILYSHRTKSHDGQRIHIEALTRALGAIGHRVTIVGPEGVRAPGDPLPSGTGQSNDARRLPSRPGAAMGAAKDLAELGYGAIASPRLLRAAREVRPDLIYERYSLFHHAGEMVSRRLGVPLLLEVNAPLVEERAATGMLTLRGLGRWSEDRAWRAADAVLPVSGVLADIVAGRGVPRDRLHVIPNGVHDEMLTPRDGEAVRRRLALPAHGILVGFTGFVRDWHRVERVVDWLATPAGRDARLLVVGDGPAIPGLQARAGACGVAERFHVTGVVPQAQVIDYVAAFDIALQPAVTPYASPLKLQEYMAQGRAIIAPAQPNIEETVTHDDTAWLVPPDDDAGFAAGLDTLAGDPVRRARLGAAARTRLEDRNMTWRGNAARVAEIGARLIGGASQGAART